MAAITSDLILTVHNKTQEITLLENQAHLLIQQKPHSPWLLRLKHEYLEHAKEFAKADMLAEMFSTLKGAEKFARTRGFEWNKFVMPIVRTPTFDQLADCAQDAECELEKAFSFYKRFPQYKNCSTHIMLRALGVDPEDPLLYLILGINLFENERYKTAALMFDKAIMYDKDSYLGRFGLANSFYHLEEYDQARLAQRRYKKLRDFF